MTAVKFCERCGAPYQKPPRNSATQWESRKFCSHECRHAPVNNRYRIDGDVAYVDVGTKMYPAKEAMIDVADLSIVLDGRGKWYARFANGTTFYATREINAGGKTSAEQLHR